MPCYDARDHERVVYKDKIVEVPQETASYEQRQARRVLEVLTEINTGTPVNSDEFNSTDIRENELSDALDPLTEMACTWFKKQPHMIITSMSLEAQIWWRDHQAMDARREAAE